MDSDQQSQQTTKKKPPTRGGLNLSGAVPPARPPEHGSYVDPVPFVREVQSPVPPTSLPESIPEQAVEDKSKQPGVTSTAEKERIGRMGETKEMALSPFSDSEREYYPPGEGFDKRYEYFPTYVLRGMREIIEDAMKQTGYKKMMLTSIAYIALLEEEFGYDMSAFHDKLPQYYRYKEMRDKIKQIEEAEKKKEGLKKKRKKKDNQ